MKAATAYLRARAARELLRLEREKELLKATLADAKGGGPEDRVRRCCRRLAPSGKRASSRGAAAAGRPLEVLLRALSAQADALDERDQARALAAPAAGAPFDLAAASAAGRAAAAATYVRRADLQKDRGDAAAAGYSGEMSRGDAAAATRTFREDESRRRPRRGHSVEMNRGDAVALT